MSTEKLNIQDLVAGLAKKTGETKKDAELFWREFVAIIQEALLVDELVKVKGFGTFKLQWNESRKSVNVNTGEEIEIAGYHKIVFTPDSEMKEAVNQPFAHLETVNLDDENETETVSSEPKIDPIKNLSVQAIEIASLISDINVEVKPDEEIHTIKEPIEIKVEAPIIIKEEVIETIICAEASNKEHFKKIEELQDELEVEIDTEEEKPKKRKGCFWKVLLILLLLLLAGIVACYFLFPKSIYRDFIDQMILKKDQPTLVDERIPECDVMQEDEYADYQSEPEQTLPALAYLFNPFDYEMNYVTVRDGTRLAWYSTRYYGSYIFWSYIYLANKDIMSDPNSLEVGTTIRIPKLPKEMIDINNPKSIEQVTYIQAHLEYY